MEPLTVQGMAERLGTTQARVRTAMLNLRARNLGVVTCAGLCRATPTGRSWVRLGHTRKGRGLDPSGTGRAESEADAWATVTKRLNRSGWTCWRELGRYWAYHAVRQRRIEAATVSGLLAYARATKGA